MDREEKEYNALMSTLDLDKEDSELVK